MQGENGDAGPHGLGGKQVMTELVPYCYSCNFECLN